MKIIKRNGSEAEFDIEKIRAAITKANKAGGNLTELTDECMPGDNSADPFLCQLKGI